jgi:hypothetical protein
MTSPLGEKSLKETHGTARDRAGVPFVEVAYGATAAEGKDARTVRQKLKTRLPQGIHWTALLGNKAQIES